MAQEAHAAEVGRNVLRAGGNAIDAAVATAFALAVTVPEAGNLGGGGFIVAYLADRRELVTVDFRETAPRSASPRMYLGSDDKPRPRHRAGAWAAGVPGTVRGLGLAHARWGKLPWAGLVLPAAGLAREGFPISGNLAGSLNNQLCEHKNTESDDREDHARLADFKESVAAFARPDRAEWKAGDRLIQSDLAATLERIASGWPRRILRRTHGPVHRSVHGGKGWSNHGRRPGDIPGQTASPGAYHVSRLRRLEHGPPLVRGCRALSDAQHPRAVRSQGRRPRSSAHRAPDHRGNASSFLHAGSELGRPRFRGRSNRRTGLKGRG